MGRRQPLWRTVLAAAALAACAPAAERPVEVDSATPQRIVSLAPSLTETLFAIGAGDRVVGVTRYCQHPPEVASRPRVGGHLDPNLEAIVGLEPDLVVAIPSGRDTGRRLEGLGIRALVVDQSSVPAILQSVTRLAEVCGVADRGATVRQRMEHRLSRVRSLVTGAPRPRTVVVVGRQSHAGNLGAVWVAGRDTFYDQVVRIAGGDNAVDVGLVRFPELSREGLAALDPEVILEVMAATEAEGLDLDRLRSSWRMLTELRAVRGGRVHLLVGDHLVVPGPRLPLMVEAVARTLHPEIAWDAE